MNDRTRTWKDRQIRLFQIVQIGPSEDKGSRLYDFIGTLLLILNLTASILQTYESVELKYGAILDEVVRWTVLFFAIDYVLRLLTASCLFPNVEPKTAVRKYVLSLSGIIDFLSFIPYYLPFFFPSGAMAFRMFRVIRVFRLFRINKYYDSVNVITQVIYRKRQQLLSSVFIILVLMLASSLSMYSVEHNAQPEVFENAFSGFWWTTSTLLTIGYGDIYPITTMGQVLSIIIAFLGVGMVAIPTGIISAGFVEEYQRVKRLSDYGVEADLRFIEVKVSKTDAWCGKQLDELALPQGMMVAAVLRGRKTMIPSDDIEIRANDTLIIGADAIQSDYTMELKEITLRKEHPWVGNKIMDLDISRQSVIVMIKRRGKGMVPRRLLVLMEGDEVYLYTKRLDDPDDDMLDYRELQV